jgi:hypothetical protein
VAAEPRRWWGPLLTLVVVAIIAWLTLRPAPEDAEAAAQSSFWCLWPCGMEALRDGVLNVLMFVPLGFTLRLWLPGRLTGALVVLATLGIEGTQWLFLVGRDASLRDLLTNALGGWLGMALAAWGRRLLFPSSKAAPRLAALGLVGWLATVALTAMGVRPTLPRSVYWGQHMAVLGQFEVYQGELLEAAIDGWPFPNGRVGDSEGFRARLLADSVLITATVVSGPPPEGTAPIVSVFDEAQRQVLVLAQDRGNILFAMRTGLAAVELADQNLVLPGFPGSTPGDTVHLTAGNIRGTVLVRAESGGRVKEARWRRSAGWLWSGLHPFYKIIPPTAWVLTALWLGGLLVPGGYWLARATRGVSPLPWLLLTVTLGLAGTTTLAGIPIAEPREWLGSLLGGGAGWLAGWLSLRRDSPAGGP